MSEPDPVHPWTGELTAADHERLGAEPLGRSDPVVIGPYRVLARLGGGGMGRLYLAREADLDAGGPTPYGADALVAVKVIRPEHAEDERFRRRFEREVEAVRRVHGRYTAGLLGSGFDEDERLWMATSYVPGLSLEDAVRRFGPLPAPVVWRLATEIGEGLATIAATGIVHRDLKPSNVLLSVDGARVIDFGVAHTADASVLTMTGQQVGTPAFMSPEQADGREAGTPSDVFSLGSVLAHAATGRGPFGEGATLEVIHRVVHSPPSPDVLTAVEQVDPELAELVKRCLDKDPAARPNPQEVVDTARERTPAQQWPAPLAELIGSRAGWTGRAAHVSPMDQLTVLRRGAPERTAGQTVVPRKRHGRMWAAVAAVVAVAAGAFFFVGPGSGDGSDSGDQARPGTTATQSQPPGDGQDDGEDSGEGKPAPTGSQPSDDDPGTPPKETDDAGSDNPPGGDEPDDPPSEADPGDEAPLPPAEDDPEQPTSAPGDGPAPKPWEKCTYYDGTALTQYGNKGDRVREVQCILKARGYDVGSDGVDGDFGQDTRSAVRSFQQKRHLQVDGQVGANTWSALRG